MTNEQAVKWLKAYLQDTPFQMEQYEQAFEMAIKALSQEQKSGKWIELPKALNPNENPCKCSECGHVLSFMNCYPKSKFCPNCGARMESEVKTE